MGNFRQEESPNWLLVQVYLATSIPNFNSVVTQVFQHFFVLQIISTLESFFPYSKGHRSDFRITYVTWRFKKLGIPLFYI